MKEVISWCALAYFFIKQIVQIICIALRSRSSKDNAFTFFYIHLEISRNIKIFIRSISTLLLLRVFHSTIPIRLKHELVFLTKLHKQFWITSIHTCLYTIVNRLIVSAGNRILMSKLSNTSESQKWSKS